MQNPRQTLNFFTLLQGLAFAAIAGIPTGPNPFFNAVQLNVLDAQQFSLYLNPDSTALDAGQLIFGGGNSSLYTGTLTTYPVIEPTYDPAVCGLIEPCRISQAKSSNCSIHKLGHPASPQMAIQQTWQP